MLVTKECTFDAAHMLSDYDGLCANLHGHTYKVQVTIEGDTNVQTGMLVDFNQLKTVLDAVKQRFDHALIFSGAEWRNSAETELYEWADRHGMRYTEVTGRCTSEVISLEILSMVQDLMPEHVLSVKLWETPTSFCEGRNE